MTRTALDAALAAAAADPGDDGLRLRVHGQLLEAELFLLLDAEPEDDRLRPRVFPLADGPVVLAFDDEERLAQFLASVGLGASPHAALAGRRLVALLAASGGIGLGVNLGAEGSELLLDPPAVSWLAALAGGRPERAEAAPPSGFAPPSGAPEALVAALEARLAGLGDLHSGALLASAETAHGSRLLLALTGVPAEAEAVVAAALAETLRFLAAAPAVDITFLADDAPALPAIAAVARRLVLPAAPPEPAPRERAGPGMDPARPPILR